MHVPDMLLNRTKSKTNKNHIFRKARTIFFLLLLPA